MSNTIITNKESVFLDSVYNDILAEDKLIMVCCKTDSFSCNDVKKLIDKGCAIDFVQSDNVVEMAFALGMIVSDKAENTVKVLMPKTSKVPSAVINMINKYVGVPVKVSKPRKKKTETESVTVEKAVVHKEVKPPAPVKTPPKEKVKVKVETEEDTDTEPKVKPLRNDVKNIMAIYVKCKASDVEYDGSDDEFLSEVAECFRSASSKDDCTKALNKKFGTKYGKELAKNTFEKYDVIKNIVK